MEKVDIISDDVAAIRRLLEGDKYSTGLVEQVRHNTTDLMEMKRLKETAGYSNDTLFTMSWLFFVLALVTVVIETGIAIGDIRHLIPLTPIQAWVLSATLGLASKFFVAFPAAIFAYGLINRR